MLHETPSVNEVLKKLMFFYTLKAILLSRLTILSPHLLRDIEECSSPLYLASWIFRSLWAPAPCFQMCMNLPHSENKNHFT